MSGVSPPVPAVTAARYGRADAPDGGEVAADVDGRAVGRTVMPWIASFDVRVEVGSTAPVATCHRADLAPGRAVERAERTADVEA